MSFHTDLAQGIKTEVSFISYLRRKGMSAKRNPSEVLEKQKLYDVLSADGTTWEIKLDRKWAQTKNVYVEDKAISSSRSTFIIYKLLDKPGWFWIARKDLLALLKKKCFRKVRGGDFSAVGTLIPYSDFIKLFKDMRDWQAL